MHYTASGVILAVLKVETYSGIVSFLWNRGNVVNTITLLSMYVNYKEKEQETFILHIRPYQIC